MHATSGLRRSFKDPTFRKLAQIQATLAKKGLFASSREGQYMGEVTASCEDTGPPLRRIRQGAHKHPFMKRAGVEAAGGAGIYKQPKRSQVKEAEAVTGREMADKQPTEREIAAAKAARARLYGGEGGAKVILIQWINDVLLSYILYVIRTSHDSRTAFT